MAKHWQQEYNYDRTSPSWLETAGRSGRLSQSGKTPTPDEPVQEVIAEGGEGKPVVARVVTTPEPPITRGRMREEFGR